MRSKSTITIKKDEKGPEPVEILAKAIISVDASAKKLLGGPLRPETLYILIREAMPAPDRITLKDIKNVMMAASKLKFAHIK